MASVEFKVRKNSRTHNELPSMWELNTPYEAHQYTDTHTEVLHDEAGVSIIWPNEDLLFLEEVQPTPPTPKKTASDGGATGYYDLPEGCITLYDLIEYKDMNFSEGNVFKAIYRMGDKEGIDPLYDWRKIKFCAEREIARLEKL